MGVKLIPAYSIMVFALFAAADMLGAFHGSGVISTQGILAVALGIVGGFALVGTATAWAVYRVHRRKNV